MDQLPCLQELVERKTGCEPVTLFCKRVAAPPGLEPGRMV